jgi:hypothetical protein
MEHLNVHPRHSRIVRNCHTWPYRAADATRACECDDARIARIVCHARLISMWRLPRYARSCAGRVPLPSICNQARIVMRHAAAATIYARLRETPRKQAVDTHVSHDFGHPTFRLGRQC